MKRFFLGLKKYYPYIKRAAKCDLKSEVANSHLNWLWWILDPLFFMLVYIFIALIVFQRGELYFPVFVFIGLTIWNFFSKNVSASVTLVRSNKSIVTKVYIPKYVLIIEKMFVNFFKMLISFGLTALLMLIYQVPASFHFFQLIPVLMVLVTVTFGVCTILLHFGVFIEDLSNVVTIVLRLGLYLSGIFYSIITRVPEPYNQYLLNFNPIALCMDAARNSLLYQGSAHYLPLLVWMVLGVLLSIIGVNLIYKHENSYAKVI